RFNLEMMPDCAFAAGVADDPKRAVAKARTALAAGPQEVELLHSGLNAGALDAVRDVMGWNTLYDTANRRRTTSISRIWNLGDFAVWFNDQTYTALMTQLFDPALGRENLAVALASETPQGNVACLLTSRDAWVDRSQPPNGALVAFTMYLRSRDRSLLDLAFGPLARNHRWWRAHRDPDACGLVSCGTSDIGSALYKGTHFGARNESGMDNSATHDEAVYEPTTRTLSTFDVGLSAQLALDAEMLSLIAGELGHAEEVADFARLAELTREAIRARLWDGSRGLFANRQRDGGFVGSVSPTTFYPLLCGAATADQARILLAHLSDPETFGGTFVIPNATRDDPAFADDVYWRGRIWPNVNFLIWQGLRRSGFHAEATELAQKSLALFEKPWREARLCGENYSARTGEVTDAPDTDPFYSWGAMLPLMAVGEVMDVNPWTGWEIAHTGEALRLGPVASPAGFVTLHSEGGTLTLRRGEDTLFETDYRGRLTHLVIERGLISVTFADKPEPGATFRIGASIAERLALARISGRRIELKPSGDLRGVDLSEDEGGARLDLHLAPSS
ncbi:MAG: glycoside hydrolase family 37, partial [Rhizobiaceae bacterium]|nr:glycoside hydrolase family 37 [Rhizobiaceae bacterium]